MLKEGITDVKAGTIHTLQGSEKSVIIMSSALSPKTSKKTMEWIKNNHELINVAVTRAKNKFIFVGDKEAIDALQKSQEIHSEEEVQKQIAFCERKLKKMQEKKSEEQNVVS